MRAARTVEAFLMPRGSFQMPQYGNDLRPLAMGTVRGGVLARAQRGAPDPAHDEVRSHMKNHYARNPYVGR